jgi:hypothetical protein
VACPYFYPVARRAGDTGARSAMLPLGAVWTGECRAMPTQMPAPEDALLECLCTLGYARGRCLHFPAGNDAADAVRFTICGDDGARLEVFYVLERDHHPYSQGKLEFSLAISQFISPPLEEIFRRQAEAYVESYLRRKREASAGFR